MMRAIPSVDSARTRGGPLRPQQREDESTKALVWRGVDDVRVDTVDDPKLVEPTDVMVKITATAICGSDLHLLGTDRAHVLREAIMCCRTAGTLSVPGVFVGMIDKMPFGSAMNRGITIRTGQTHVQRYTQLLLERIEAGEIDPSFVITHRTPLDDAPELYRKFRDKQDGCIKVVMTP
jgi:threonine dehydrogenase-like Zn-dependent dehydrogenase